MNALSERFLGLSVFGHRLLDVRLGRVWGEVVEPRPAVPPVVTVPAAAQVAVVPPAPVAVLTAPAVDGRGAAGGDGAVPVFVVSSLLLHDAYRLLTTTEDEDLHAVTGLVFPRTRVLERIIPLRLSSQSTVGAEAADDSLAAELIRLNEFGMRPLAYFHSHPGHGPSATEPSSTDRKTQAGMERAGGQIIGGIFSRDGFVRFYANRAEPHIKVLGKKTRRVERNVYHLEAEDVHWQDTPPSCPRRRR